MEQEQVEAMLVQLKSRAEEFNVTVEQVDAYMEGLEDCFEPRAYQHMTLSDLAEDVQVYWMALN